MFQWYQNGTKTNITRTARTFSHAHLLSANLQSLPYTNVKYCSTLKSIELYSEKNIAKPNFI